MQEPDSTDQVPSESGQNAEGHSPLWIVSTEPLLNELVRDLDKLRRRLISNPGQPEEIVFSRSHLARVNAAFDAMIRRGEEALHQMCELFCATFLNAYQMESVVIGEVPSTRERFTLGQIISREDLYSTMDLALGNRQLMKLRYFDGTAWMAPGLVVNVVEYQPLEPNKYGIYKIISRIKAEEELWNKVVDEIFDLDSLVRRDKQLSHLSRYIKDVFGIKIVVGAALEVQKFDEVLQLYRWDNTTLESLGIVPGSDTSRLDFIEEKSYLGQSDKKMSGWEAKKSVVRWSGRTFEIQIQPLRNFWREREHITRESHAGFKSRREQVREQVAEQIPLFRFFQVLLKWLFHDMEGATPQFPGVTVKIEN